VWVWGANMRDVFDKGIERSVALFWCGNLGSIKVGQGKSFGGETWHGWVVECGARGSWGQELGGVERD
jgi:hypothetical protein